MGYNHMGLKWRAGHDLWLNKNGNIAKSDLYPQMKLTGLEDSGFTLKEKD